MVIACCAVGCTNRQGCKPNLSFYHIPVDGERRKLWIAAINRKDWLPSRYSRICSEHFIKGQKSQNPFSPDYVPSVFAKDDSPPITQSLRSSYGHRMRQEMKKRKNKKQSAGSEGPKALLNLSAVGTKLKKDTEKEASVCDVDVSNERQVVYGETLALKQKLSFDLLEQNGLENIDKLKALTGLQNYQVFMAVFDLVKTVLRDNSHMTSFQQLLITLMRLTVNLPVSFLSNLFGVKCSTVSRVFTNVINILDEILVPLCVVWPQMEHLQISMPMCFRNSFKDCASVIDCFEILIDKSKVLKSRANSQYKFHHSVKYLIRITPQGVISYVSKGWGGRTTDAHIITNSGFLDHLQPGDVILSGRGFTIQNQVGLYCAKAEASEFRWGRKQLRTFELEDTQRLEAVRIHVERLIGQARSKYKILHGPVPIRCLSSDDGKYTTLDKIVRVACALTNLCPSVVPAD